MDREGMDRAQSVKDANTSRRAGEDEDDPQYKTRAEWFRTGRLLDSDDVEIKPLNLGLSGRERRCLSAENAWPWGHPMFAQRAIADRATEAERRGRVQGNRGWTEDEGGKQAPDGWFEGRPKRLVEKREGAFGQEQVTQRNKQWFE